VLQNFKATQGVKTTSLVGAKRCIYTFHFFSKKKLVVSYDQTGINSDCNSDALILKVNPLSHKGVVTSNQLLHQSELSRCGCPLGNISTWPTYWLRGPDLCFTAKPLFICISTYNSTYTCKQVSITWVYTFLLNNSIGI
jgi:hypothetical protein